MPTPHRFREQFEQIRIVLFFCAVAIGIPLIVYFVNTWLQRQIQNWIARGVIVSAFLGTPYLIWLAIAWWQGRDEPSQPAPDDALDSFVRRHAGVLGLLLLLLGAWMFGRGYVEGRRFAQFEGGRMVRARVERVYDAAGRPLFPDLRADIRWYDADGRIHSGFVNVTKMDFERLRPGDGFNLILSRFDPATFTTERTLEDAAYSRIAGVPLAGIGIFGAPIGVIGLGLVAWGVVRAVQLGRA